MQNHEQLPDTQTKKPCWKVTLLNWLKENSRYLIVATAAIICCVILGVFFYATMVRIAPMLSLIGR